jgi:hypothetical protein
MVGIAAWRSFTKMVPFMARFQFFAEKNCGNGIGAVINSSPKHATMAILTASAGPNPAHPFEP